MLFRSVTQPSSRLTKCVACCAVVAFTDDDHLLGSKLHNHPHFVCGYINEGKVNCILIDGGSTVNIMPKLTMRKLGISVSDLSQSRLTIQGFNQGSQKAIGMLRVDLKIKELEASTLFHIIDAKTSNSLFFGRP